jgi:hypothetical protein
MSVAPSSPFPVDALESNRGGRLTPAQRQALSRLSRSDRKNEFTGSFVFIAMGVLVLVGVDSSKPPLLHYGFPVACFLVAAFFLYRSTAAGDALTRDVRAARVESVQGALRKWSVSSGTGSTLSSYYVEVERERFHVSWHEYEAIPQAGIVRVYYLPQSRMVVNLEQLPDRPLAPGALESPIETVKDAFAGMRSHDRVRSAEAMATLQALGNAEKAVFEGATNAPPSGPRDSRPLAEAILGTWQLGPMKVTFRGDGTASVGMPFGGPREGHWSVDSGGRLHFDGLNGKDEATEAWVSGDALTVSLDGQAMTAHRLAG